MACRSSLSSGRFERATEADAITRSNMGRRYTSVRLFVSFFQPSFKLASKTRDGAKVTKHYYPPATPYQRLLADPRAREAVRACVNALQATLDPVRLLSEIRLAQKQLVEIADRPATSETASVSLQTLEKFLEGLRTSWQEGEVRPTSKPKKNVGKYWRRCPDPRLTVAAQLREWFDAGPWRTSRELLERLQGEQPDTYPINCCERCSAVSSLAAGKRASFWCSAPRFPT